MKKFRICGYGVEVVVEGTLADAKRMAKKLFDRIDGSDDVSLDIRTIRSDRLLCVVNDDRQSLRDSFEKRCNAEMKATSDYFQRYGEEQRNLDVEFFESLRG